jgi:hypothetical protein
MLVRHPRPPINNLGTVVLAHDLSYSGSHRQEDLDPEASPRQKLITMTRGVAQVAECLSSKLKALYSIPNTTKRKKGG